MEISDIAIKLIQVEEDFRPKAYRDPNPENGHLICFGNRYHPDGRRVSRGDYVTFDRHSVEAKNYIIAHLKKYVYPIIDSTVKVNITQSEFDAFCCFVYNTGYFGNSLAKAINSQNRQATADAFLLYNKYKQNGVLKYSKVIDKRRKRERTLFLSGTANVNKPSTPRTSSPSGNVTFSVEVDKYKINPTLLEDLIKASQISGLSFNVGTAIAGHKKHTASGNISRHYVGNAVDINEIDGFKYSRNPSNFTRVAEKLSSVFESMGYNRNVESGKDRAVLFGESIDHANHVHVSCRVRTASKNPTSIEVATNEGLNSPEIQPEQQKPYCFIISDSDYTADEFIELNQINMSPEELINYDDFNNKESIYNAYKPSQKTQYKEASKELIASGTRVAVPFNKRSNKSVYLINQNIIENTTFNAFIEGKIKYLIENKRYKKLNINRAKQLGTNGDFFVREEHISVLLWSRVADPSGNQLIDLTPHIRTINTNSNIDGSNFSIVLPHITYNESIELSKLDNSGIELDMYSYNNKINYIHKSSLLMENGFNNNVAYIHESDIDILNQTENAYFQRRESLFSNIISPNDVIFIRLEKLDIDTDMSHNSKDFRISNNVINGKVFDIIGLVDNVRKVVSDDGKNQEISISGKDLSKLLIDDGTYFFPIEYAVEDREQIIKNSSKTKAGNRLIIPGQNSNDNNNNDAYAANTRFNTGVYMGDVTFNFMQTQSIDEWLVFIFSQLTNIDIAPDNLFQSYNDKNFIITRSQRKEDNYTQSYQKMLANGIWQSVRLAIDPSVGARRIADPGLTVASGSLINLIRKVCQEPFVEFFMDTYGDRYYFICRKPPFAEQEYKTNFCLNVYEQDVYGDSIDWNNEFYTWFKLNPAGSIINASDGESLAILPAVMLPEYMEVWGSKVLDITTQYLDYDTSQTEQSETNLNNIIKQGKQDLDWLIETNAYLPFTRQGEINIKPDRRIKRGMNIRYMPTGEIFHVDGVSHTKALSEKVDGLTVLQVSRGMVEEHLEKYFRIVNLLRLNKNNDEWDKDTWTVNQDIFKFFLQRKQMTK